MKKIVLTWCLGALVVSLSGCAVPMVERKTAREYELRGFERSDRNPEMLIQELPTDAVMAKVGIVVKPVKLSINDAAWTSHGVQMFFATVWDYVVLPVAGTGAAVWGGSKLMSAGGGDRTKSTTISANNGGQVNINNGTGSANQAGPAVTTTSTTAP